MTSWIYYTLSGLLTIVLPLILSSITTWYRNVMSRLDTLEKTTITESKVRQLMSDKLDPIQDDIHEIKDFLKILNERLLNR